MIRYGGRPLAAVGIPGEKMRVTEPQMEQRVVWLELKHLEMTSLRLVQPPELR